MSRHEIRPQPMPSVAVIVIDDIGVDMIGAYGEAPAPPHTPNIDALAAGGVLFRNAWASPVCSPTRSTILTGRHAFRTGIGFVVRPGGGQIGLPVTEKTLPKLLKRYRTSAVGKWHLAHPQDKGDGQGLEHPLNVGFRYYAGSMWNAPAGPVPTQGEPNGPPGCVAPYNYFNWVKNTNGTQACTSRYMTSDTADEGVRRVRDMRKPFFLYAAFNAAHKPFHTPPPELCSGDPAAFCTRDPGTLTPAERVKTIVEALDFELGRMITEMRRIEPELTIILVGDNGTTGEGSEGMPGGCFDPARAKGSPYEAGIRVPLIINGPRVEVPHQVQHPVHAVDIFATVLELTGHGSNAEDSVSMVPYMVGESPALRPFNYSEVFRPNGPLSQVAQFNRTIRDVRGFKLIRRIGRDDELYDLIADPCEANDLFPNLMSGSEAESHYNDLVAELVNMGVAGGGQFNAPPRPIT